MTTPIWLKDEPWLDKWLGWFLDKLDSRAGDPSQRAITRFANNSVITL